MKDVTEKIFEELQSLETERKNLLEEEKKLFIAGLKTYIINNFKIDEKDSKKVKEEKENLSTFLKNESELFKMTTKEIESKIIELSSNKIKDPFVLSLSVLEPKDKKRLEKNQEAIKKNNQERIEKLDQYRTALNEKLSLTERMYKLFNSSLLENIEEYDEKEIKKELTEEEKEELKTLKEKIADIKSIPNYENKPNCKEELENLRRTISIILDIDIFEYSANKVKNLDESKQKEYENFKAKLTKTIENEKSERKKANEKDEKEKNELDKIREKMAAILYRDPKKAYEGIEKEDENHPAFYLDDEQKKEYANLREQFNNLIGKESQELTTDPLSLISAKSTQPNNKKRRKVKFFKKATDFYKKHKKTILLIAGLVILGIALYHLLPSIMYFNSWMWHKAIAEGAIAEVGLPKFLHDVNLLIGGNIGAQFNSAQGIWTLANGTILNEGVKNASIIVALGKVGLSVGSIGIGSTIAIKNAKNAYKLAKERIEKRKIKKDNNPNEKSTINKFAESLKKGFEKVTEKKKEPKTTTETKENKNNNKEETTEKLFHRNDLSERLNNAVLYFANSKIINEKELEILKKLPKKEFVQRFTEIFNERLRKPYYQSQQNLTSYDRKDILFSVKRYINYCLNTGVFTQKDIEHFNSLDGNTLNRLIFNDPKFIEYENMIRQQPSEEKTKGSK